MKISQTTTQGRNNHPPFVHVQDPSSQPPLTTSACGCPLPPAARPRAPVFVNCYPSSILGMRGGISVYILRLVPPFVFCFVFCSGFGLTHLLGGPVGVGWGVHECFVTVNGLVVAFSNVLYNHIMWWLIGNCEIGKPLFKNDQENNDQKKLSPKWSKWKMGAKSKSC